MVLGMGLKKPHTPPILTIKPKGSDKIEGSGGWSCQINRLVVPSHSLRN
jgi:hypothetical protein